MMGIEGNGERAAEGAAVATDRKGAGDSKVRMIKTTAKLLQRQGYHATGLNQIVAESGSPKGSMYFYFPGGKEQLAAEAIALAGRRITGVLQAHAADTALASLDAYLVTVATYLERSDYADGCPIATVALEVGPTSTIVGQACADAFDRSEAEVAAWLERDGAEPGEAARLATIVYAAIEGALLLAKARRSNQPLERLRAALPDLLGQPRP